MFWTTLWRLSCYCFNLSVIRSSTTELFRPQESHGSPPRPPTCIFYACIQNTAAWLLYCFACTITSEMMCFLKHGFFSLALDILYCRIIEGIVLLQTFRLAGRTELDIVFDTDVACGDTDTMNRTVHLLNRQNNESSASEKAIISLQLFSSLCQFMVVHECDEHRAFLFLSIAKCQDCHSSKTLLFFSPRFSMLVGPVSRGVVFRHPEWLRCWKMFRDKCWAMRVRTLNTIWTLKCMNELHLIRWNIKPSVSLIQWWFFELPTGIKVVFSGSFWDWITSYTRIWSKRSTFLQSLTPDQTHLPVASLGRVSNRPLYP